jgi:HTH-type transcriptional regulator/antitoxin HipB
MADAPPFENDSQSARENLIGSSADVGEIARARRKNLGLKQTDIAGLGGTGNRFIVDLENGKPTMQLQKALDVLDLLGLEVIVRPKTPRGA